MIKGCTRVVFGLSMMLSLHSCGYRFSQHHAHPQLSTITLPYVKGDLDGKLTAAIVTQLTRSCKWDYVSDHPDCVLDIEMIRDYHEHIGYQYDSVKSTAELINRLIPNEGRRHVQVRLKVWDAKREQLLYGPYEIEASGDYDFVNFDAYKDLAFVNQEGVAQSVLTFSLGQLDAQEGAVEAVLTAVYQALAEKIVIGLDRL